MVAIMWKLHNAFIVEATAAGLGGMDIAKDDLLGELSSNHSSLMAKLDDMSVCETLDYALNMVHEQPVVVYLQYHYIYEVVSAFQGDKLYLLDQSLPTHERVLGCRG
jgi:hypothetical protein